MSKPKTVYRVENDLGFGPYHMGLGTLWDEHHTVSRFTPTPGIDLIDGTWADDEWVFGFPSKTALRRWFTPSFRRALAARGFVVHRYEVRPDDVAVSVSGRQLAFSRDDMHYSPVETIDLATV